MGLRLFISRLASAQTRGAAARGLATLCGAGLLITIIVLAARGALERWFFALLVWALLVYVPLRIALEAAGTLAPALRRRLAVEAVRNTGRFSATAGTELTVDRLLDREVVMPRIATPLQREKAREGALAVLLAMRGKAGGLPATVVTALGCLHHWVTDIGPWAQREAGQNIQIRWREVRALAAMAAMTKILLAADDAAADDRRGSAGEMRKRVEFLDACLDYCDDLALEVDVRLWDEPVLPPRITVERAAAIRDAWRVYAETGAPALESRKAFLDLLLQPTPAAAP
ncbi:MAG TPA: hypothetical protein VI007_02955 [bacterium]